jgi:hypothetical protein
MDLTDTEQAILDFEQGWFKYAGRKESAIRERFDMTSTRYYQRLGAIIDNPEALAHDPMTVRRLRRLRDRRRAVRSRAAAVPSP